LAFPQAVAGRLNLGEGFEALVCNPSLLIDPFKPNSNKINWQMAFQCYNHLSVLFSDSDISKPWFTTFHRYKDRLAHMVHSSQHQMLPFRLSSSSVSRLAGDHIRLLEARQEMQKTP
jgi:hypothetical protein